VLDKEDHDSETGSEPSRPREGVRNPDFAAQNSWRHHTIRQLAGIQTLRTPFVSILLKLEPNFRRIISSDHSRFLAISLQPRARFRSLDLFASEARDILKFHPQVQFLFLDYYLSTFRLKPPLPSPRQIISTSPPKLLH
jgi:hypothetical protein